MLLAALAATLLLAGCPAGDEETGGTDAGTASDASPAGEEAATE
jgi:hypothetical protein